jgi:hypothetical protein
VGVTVLSVDRSILGCRLSLHPVMESPSIFDQLHGKAGGALYLDNGWATYVRWVDCVHIACVPLKVAVSIESWSAWKVGGGEVTIRFLQTDVADGISALLARQPSPQLYGANLFCAWSFVRIPAVSASWAG